MTHDTLGTIPLAAGVVTTLRTSAKISVREIIDYTTYIKLYNILVPTHEELLMLLIVATIH